MIIHNVFAIIGLIIATIFGLYGQSLAYFLYEIFPLLELKTLITILTLISIGLYIIIPISFFISHKINKQTFYIYLIAGGFIGLPISFWSFFVWAMWMG